MKKVLLILFNFENLEQVIKHTFKLLNSKDKLYVTGFIEEEIPDSLNHLISDIGFLGKKVTDDVEETIVNEYQDRAEKNLDDIDKQGEDIKAEVDVELLPKEKLSKLKRKLRKGKFDHLIINYTNDEFISEEVLVYPLEELLQEINIPYQLYYDGKLNQDKT